jgi:mannose-6-phosphate isomerase-like protein (cupin superfamily)
MIDRQFHAAADRPATTRITGQIIRRAIIGGMAYHVVHARDLPWEERTPPEGHENDPARLAADLTTAAQLGSSRARLWRYPPGSRGRRHADKAQEEVFVVLAGTLTMHLGEPPERIELEPPSVVAVEPGTPLQLRNDGLDDAVVFIYGAPPEQAGADFFPDAGP